MVNDADDSHLEAGIPSACNRLNTNTGYKRFHPATVYRFIQPKVYKIKVYFHGDLFQ